METPAVTSIAPSAEAPRLGRPESGDQFREILAPRPDASRTEAAGPQRDPPRISAAPPETLRQHLDSLLSELGDPLSASRLEQARQDNLAALKELVEDHIETLGLDPGMELRLAVDPRGDALVAAPDDPGVRRLSQALAQDQEARGLMDEIAGQDALLRLTLRQARDTDGDRVPGRTLRAALEREAPRGRSATLVVTYARGEINAFSGLDRTV